MDMHVENYVVRDVLSVCKGRLPNCKIDLNLIYESNHLPDIFFIARTSRSHLRE